jgi:hypothetical protein
VAQALSPAAFEFFTPSNGRGSEEIGHKQLRQEKAPGESAGPTIGGKVGDYAGTSLDPADTSGSPRFGQSLTTLTAGAAAVH